MARGATIYLSKYMVEAIPVSAISQCVIIIVNNIEMHVHLSSLEPTELVNGLASLLLLLKSAAVAADFRVLWSWPFSCEQVFPKLYQIFIVVLKIFECLSVIEWNRFLTVDNILDKVF